VICFFRFLIDCLRTYLVVLVGKTAFNKLYDFISEIANDGMVMYKGTPKANEYKIVNIIERLRSGNSWGGDESYALVALKIKPPIGGLFLLQL
jgi:hypothetical protein